MSNIICKFYLYLSVILGRYSCAHTDVSFSIELCLIINDSVCVFKLSMSRIYIYFNLKLCVLAMSKCHEFYFSLISRLENVLFTN